MVAVFRTFHVMRRRRYSMINRILLLCFALALVACGGEAPAVLGQACAVQGDYGEGVCPLNTCLDGTSVPGRLRCSSVGRWACVYDACPRATSPTCLSPSDTEFVSCRERLGMCRNGGPLPFRLTCENGAWVCRADFDRCSNVNVTDAGQPADAQVADGGAESSDLVYSQSFDGPATQSLNPGTQRAVLLRFRLRFGETVELRSLPVTLEGPTTSDTITGGNGQLVATDIRLIDRATGQQVLNPLVINRGEVITPRLAAIVGVFEGGSYRLEANQEYTFDVVADLPQRVDPELFGRPFRVRLGEAGLLFTDRSILRVSQNEYFTVNRGLNPAPIVGNLHSIAQPRVAVTIASFEAAQTVTRNSPSVHTLRVRYENFGSGLVFPVSVRFTGAADLGAGYRTQNFARVMLACGHNCDEGGTTPRRVPSDDGRITFERFTGAFANGSRTCSITCSTDSVVTGRDGDRAALGIANPSDVLFEDTFGNPVLVDLNPDLSRQITAPTHTVTVVTGGYLTVSSYPVTNQAVDGSVATWYQVGSYALSVTHEEGILGSVGLRIDGARNCLDQVRVETFSAAPVIALVPFGASHVDVFWSSPERLPAALTSLTIYARTRQVVDPRIDPNGCHPGDSVTVSLDYGDTSPEWGAFYTNAANVRVTGAVSGSILQYGNRPLPGATLLLR